MSALRKMLNLPEKERTGGENKAASPQDYAASEPPADGGKGPSDPGWNAVGWAEESESTGRSFARRAGRVVIWSVIGLAAFTGVRTWVFPAKPPAVAPQVDVQAEALRNDVPVDEAQQVAARFARSYLSWSSEAPQLRARDLARDLPKGADPKMGWNGEGLQLVSQTIAGKVTQAEGKRARVLVDVRVSYTVQSDGKDASVSQWLGLEVPVAESGGRILVTGQPALVGMPTATDYKIPDIADTDAAMSNSTRQTVKDFLTAWAVGGEDQAAAPGSRIAPLGGGVQLDSLDSWAVDVGSGDKRTGTATVRWKLAGAQLQQTYLFTLTQVSANTGSRWQVSQVTATS
ncbi:conjugal transfer protein [Streptomyces yaizuensis]|uniref:Conjugal transfer protein n=1 Tax=Streptomyces yaizuensis TaxID=2989713 RepID=A0ABQ5P6T6_9ACTN|nr:conjugal transfer protein [Streptomyces sp. YSPA8]GLF98287.1 conjugal transfer protein [Streptomyces sp. YSPA8]